jgi:hypothetical protein
MKKGQMITFDMSTTLIVFIVFIILFILLFVLAQRTGQKHEFELEYVFSNLENNLKFDNSDPSIAFLRNYRVTKGRLNNFANTVADIDSYVIGEIGNAHGIGMDEEGYDACLYFKDNDGQFIGMGDEGLSVLGRLSKIGSGSRCQEEMITNNRNPCDRYKQALAMIKPVLFDVGNPTNNRIVQMNLVICKK